MWLALLDISSFLSSQEDMIRKSRYHYISVIRLLSRLFLSSSSLCSSVFSQKLEEKGPWSHGPSWPWVLLAFLSKRFKISWKKTDQTKLPTLIPWTFIKCYFMNLGRACLFIVQWLILNQKIQYKIQSHLFLVAIRPFQNRYKIETVDHPSY